MSAPSIGTLSSVGTVIFVGNKQLTTLKAAPYLGVGNYYLSLIN